MQLWGINIATYRVSIALKLFATFFAVLTLVVYATPLTQMFVTPQVYEHYLLIIILSYVTIVVILETFFHFAFAAAVAMLFRRKINLLLMLAAIFTMIIISLASYEAVESITLSLAKNGNRGGEDMVIEGILKKQRQAKQQYQAKQALARKDYQHKRQNIALDYALEQISPNALAYDKYHARKANQLIRQQKALALAKLDASLARQQATLNKRADSTHNVTASALAQHQQAIQKQQTHSAKQFKYISLVWAIFSILSSMIMGVYEGQTKADVAQTTKQGKTTARQRTQTKANVEGFWSDRLLGFIQTNNLSLDCLNKLLPIPQDVNNQATPTPKPVPHVIIQPTTALWQEVADLFRQVDDEGKPRYSINKAKDLINAKYNTTIARHQFEKVRKHTLANKP
jgi:hypothetical protein